MFPAQLAAYADRHASRRVVDCSRRSGKSHLIAVELIDYATSTERVNQLYLTQASTDARDILWRTLLELNENYSLGGHSNGTLLEMTFSNRSFVRLGGAKDAREARRRIKGRRWHRVYLDEAQDFPGYLEELVEAGLVPTLMGKGARGTLTLVGTPGRVPGIGYYERANASPATWRRHHWTMRENPHLEGVEDYLAERAAALGATSAIHLREDLGERPLPDESTGLVYRFDPRINDLVCVTAGQHDHVIGVDLGARHDRSAIAVIGVPRGVYPGRAELVSEYIAPKRLLLPALAVELRQRIEQYKPVAVLVDAGGLGAALADQLRVEHKLPVQDADKLHELASADAVNSALVTGRFLLPKTSRAAEDMAALVWDLEAREKGIRRVAKVPHSDILDAIRYAWPMVWPLLMGVKAPAATKTPAQREADEDLEEQTPSGRSWYAEMARRRRS